MVARGLFEGERPQVVDEALKLCASAAAPDGFQGGRSACEVGVVAKVAALTSQLANALLLFLCLSDA